jgi:hypothetical protein
MLARTFFIIYGHLSDKEKLKYLQSMVRTMSVIH